MGIRKIVALWRGEGHGGCGAGGAGGALMTEGMERGWRVRRAGEDGRGVGRGGGDRGIAVDGAGTCVDCGGGGGGSGGSSGGIGRCAGADDVGGGGRGFPACCGYRGACGGGCGEDNTPCCCSNDCSRSC